MIGSSKKDGKSPRTGGKKGRVIIVGDHAAFRQALSVVMERRAGFDVRAEVASAAEARRALEALSGDIDLAVVDLDLPGPGTEDLIRELRGRMSDAAVLGLTAGYGAASSGTSEVLHTDVTLDEFLVVARQLIGG